MQRESALPISRGLLTTLRAEGDSMTNIENVVFDTGGKLCANNGLPLLATRLLGLFLIWLFHGRFLA